MKALSKIRRACEARRAQELESIRTEKAAGVKVAGYTCHAFPAAVAAGLGLRPVRVLCGTSADAESAGEQVVRADVCPQVKSLLGNVREKKSVHAEIDLWIGLHTCDQMRRGLATLSGALGREVHPLHFPATRTPEAADYYALQVRNFVAGVEAARGAKFDGNAAKSWHKAYDAAAQVLGRAARSGKLSPLDLHSLFHLLFISRPGGLAEFFEETIRSAGPFPAEKTVVLAGSPVTFEDTVLLEDLEARGIAVVPLNCTGLDAVEDGEAVVESGDVVRDLALRAFRRPTCARTRPNKPVFDRIGEAIRTANASGLIVKCLKFCDHWYTERERMRRSFGLPVLVFDSDYAEGGRERLLSRIDAFAEMLG